MSPLFSPALRETVVQAHRQALGLGHDFIGGEHLLLALAGSWTPAGAALRELSLRDVAGLHVLRLALELERDGIALRPNVR